MEGMYAEDIDCWHFQEFFELGKHCLLKSLQIWSPAGGHVRYILIMLELNRILYIFFLAQIFMLQVNDVQSDLVNPEFINLEISLYGSILRKYVSNIL